MFEKFIPGDHVFQGNMYVFSIPKPGFNGAPAPFFEKSLMKECQTRNVIAGALTTQGINSAKHIRERVPLDSKIVRNE